MYKIYFNISTYTVLNYLFIFIYWFLITFIILRIMIKRRAVPSTMAWLLIIYTIPVVGTIIYFLLGELRLDKIRIKRSKILHSSILELLRELKKYKNLFINKSSKTTHSVFQLCQKRQGIKNLKGGKIKLLINSDLVLKELLHDISLAKKNIEMIFYIWQEGGLVNKVSEELISAALRGVRCRIILDSAGCIEFFRSSNIHSMRKAGIEIVEALSVSFLRIFIRRMDLRQHRKIVLIDRHIVYTGSMNMVDPECFKQNIGVGKWIDIMVKIEGPLAIIMSIFFSFDWEIETGECILPNFSEINNSLLRRNYDYQHIVQVIASGPGFPENIIHQVLLTSIYSARKNLIITTPYLVPSDNLIHAICTAAQRGVKVRIILPRRNDSILVSWASRAFFSELLEAGVRIYEFKDGLLHTKSILVDYRLSLIGTANLDMRSLWLNLEMTLAIDSLDFGKSLARIQKDYISKSYLIKREVWSNRPIWEKIIESIFYFFSPLL